MPRCRSQFRVRNPNLFLRLSLLARPHRHARILRTNPVDRSGLSAHASRLAPQAAKVFSQEPYTNPPHAQMHEGRAKIIRPASIKLMARSSRTQSFACQRHDDKKRDSGGSRRGVEEESDVLKW